MTPTYTIPCVTKDGAALTLNRDPRGLGLTIQGETVFLGLPGIQALISYLRDTIDRVSTGNWSEDWSVPCVSETAKLHAVGGNPRWFVLKTDLWSRANSVVFDAHTARELVGYLSGVVAAYL